MYAPKSQVRYWHIGRREVADALLRAFLADPDGGLRQAVQADLTARNGDAAGRIDAWFERQAA
jgi:L-rhamnose isomerase